MKKLIVIAAASMLAGCGNMDIVDWHWNFPYAIVATPDGTIMEVEVKRWHDFDSSDMIQIETPDKVICTHSVNVLLIKPKKSVGEGK